MAAVPQSLSLEEFDRLYGDQKPYHEYCYGQAVQKAVPNIIHSVLQGVMAALLREFGLVPGTEARLKLSSEAQPLPDVIGVSRIQIPYPTKAFEIAIEILSPSDSAQYLFRECRFYAKWRIQQIVVLDPDDRTAQRWNHQEQTLESISEIAIHGRAPIAVSRIWAELDQYPRRHRFSSRYSRVLEGF